MNKMKKFISSLLALLFSFNLSSCTNKNDKYYDKITKSFELDRAYESRDFIEDGIGLATVDAYTDGDTTRFKLASGTVVAIRYFGIDCPESTANVEKWGKAASLFTKTMLKSATQIVLEGTNGDGPAVHDSYGTRYLGYVWYKTANDDHFRCLNVQIVENGFSTNKTTVVDKYYQYFNKAEKFAIAQPLRVHCPAATVDPLYSTEPVDFTLEEFEFNVDLYYNAESNAGAKVKCVLTITDLYIASSGTYNFTGVEVGSDGKQRFIQIYTGYKDSGIKVGHKYNIVGNVGQFSSKYQISGVIYDSALTDANRPDTYSTMNRRSSYFNFNSDTEKTKIGTNDTSVTSFSPTWYTDLTVTNTEVIDNTLVVTGTAYNIVNKKTSSNVTTFTINVPSTSPYFNTITTGNVLRFGGFNNIDTKTVIDVLGDTSITIK